MLYARGATIRLLLMASLQSTAMLARAIIRYARYRVVVDASVPLRLSRRHAMIAAATIIDYTMLRFTLIARYVICSYAFAARHDRTGVHRHMNEE